MRILYSELSDSPKNLPGYDGCFSNSIYVWPSGVNLRVVLPLFLNVNLKVPFIARAKEKL